MEHEPNMDLFRDWPFGMVLALRSLPKCILPEIPSAT